MQKFTATVKNGISVKIGSETSGLVDIPLLLSIFIIFIIFPFFYSHRGRVPTPSQPPPSTNVTVTLLNRNRNDLITGHLFDSVSRCAHSRARMRSVYIIIGPDMNRCSERMCYRTRTNVRRGGGRGVRPLEHAFGRTDVLLPG